MPTLPTSVVVHPLVLLSVVDHYNRVAKDSRRRVVGVLLGSTHQGKVDITNSYAVPFEERGDTWYLDHAYLTSMFLMFKKVAAKEKIVGFYSTGPKIKPTDLAIDALFRDYHPHPALVIIDVRPDVEGIPVQAYVSVNTVSADGSEASRTFTHLASEVGAYEAEEVGVEHLLRDVNDPSVSSLGFEARHKLQALKGLHERLKYMATYLEDVLQGNLPHNNQILYNMQTIMNLLPNLNVQALVKSMLTKTNDMHLVIYMSSLIRSVIALHDLVNNKSKFSADGEEESKSDGEKKAKKAGDGEDGKKSEGEGEGSASGDSSDKSSGAKGKSSDKGAKK